MYNHGDAHAAVPYTDTHQHPVSSATDTLLEATPMTLQVSSAELQPEKVVKPGSRTLSGGQRIYRPGWEKSLEKAYAEGGWMRSIVWSL